MALDGPKKGDLFAVAGAIIFCMEPELHDRVGNVSIDMGFYTFRVGSDFPDGAWAEPGRFPIERKLIPQYNSYLGGWIDPPEKESGGCSACTWIPPKQA